MKEPCFQPPGTTPSLYSLSQGITDRPIGHHRTAGNLYSAGCQRGANCHSRTCLALEMLHPWALAYAAAITKSATVIRIRQRLHLLVASRTSHIFNRQRNRTRLKKKRNQERAVALFSSGISVGQPGWMATKPTRN